MPKSEFYCIEVAFLGMIVKEGAITVNPEKIEKILNYNAPTNLRQLRGVLGMASYYKRHIKDFSQIIAPLVLMTKKDKLYHWGPKNGKAFEAIKKLLAIEPILTLPNEIDPFILAMDFSYEGMGLVFS